MARPTAVADGYLEALEAFASAFTFAPHVSRDLGFAVVCAARGVSPLDISERLHRVRSMGRAALEEATK